MKDIKDIYIAFHKLIRDIIHWNSCYIYEHSYMSFGWETFPIIYPGIISMFQKICVFVMDTQGAFDMIHGDKEEKQVFTLCALMSYAMVGIPFNNAFKILYFIA